jgi:hypothetical protein
MTYQSVTVHEARREGLFKLDDIKGISLLDEFESWLRSLPADHFKNPAKLQYGTKPIVERRNRIVIATMRTGHYGTAGDEVVNTRTHSASYRTADVDAQTVETRCALLVPPHSDTALFFVEKQGLDGCGTRVLQSFVAHFKEFAKGRQGTNNNPLSVVVEVLTVVEPDAWLEHARMESITAVVNEHTPDVADEGAVRSVPVRLSNTLTPVKGERYLPERFRSSISEKRLEAAADLGFPDLHYDEFLIRLGDGDHSKTMVIGNEKTPSIRVLLNDHVGRSLTVSELIGRIDDEAKGYYSRRELTYQLAWTRA